MFTEAAFEYEEEEEEQSNSARAAVVGSSSSTGISTAFGTTVAHFHVPGMPEYSAVAGAVNDRDAQFDPRLFNGDSWLSPECHCLRCEGLRVVGKMQSLAAKVEPSAPLTRSETSTNTPIEAHVPISASSLSPSALQPGPPVVLLLDMDNFGFRQFQLAPPRLPKNARISNDRLLSEVFVWAFFGSCFTRYYKVWPTEDLLLNLDASEGKEDIYGSQHRRKSIWSSLAEDNRLLLTPCSGNNQGADCVMREVVHAFSGYDMLVVTGDAELITILKDERRRDRKRLRESSVDDLNSPQLRFVNVSQLNKKLVPVWHAIAEQISCLRS